MARFLPETVESVLSQDYPHLEYIVMDGGSTDGTRAILERHTDRLRYSSAPDRGPSDAAYQGFHQAHGEIFAWLNADDTYLPGAVRTAVAYLQSHPEIDVVYGEGWWIDEDHAIIDRYPTRPFDLKALESDCFICQPAAFMRASAYRRCELDPHVNRSFDYDLWIRMAKAGMRFASIPDYLANSRLHGGSLTLVERGEVFRASMRLLQRHYGYIPFHWIYSYVTYRKDGRDPYYNQSQPSVLNYCLSLPAGLFYDRRHAARYLKEWLGVVSYAGFRRAWRRSWLARILARFSGS